MRKRKDNVFLDNQRGSGGFAVGFLIGAALVFLFGTEEGRQLKKKFSEKGRKFAAEVPEMIIRLQKEGEEFAHKTEEVKQELEDKLAEFTPQVKDKIQDALEHIEKTQERGRLAAEAARKHFFTRRGRKLT